MSKHEQVKILSMDRETATALYKALDELAAELTCQEFLRTVELDETLVRLLQNAHTALAKVERGGNE